MGFSDLATEDGMDVQMQSNHTSHFLLTKYALPCLERAIELRGDARGIDRAAGTSISEAHTHAASLTRQPDCEQSSTTRVACARSTRRAGRTA